MIKRIKTIKGIGRFLNTRHIELGKLNLIYGPNCYGKSTLSDIFRSLGIQNLEVLINRRSIVKDNNQVTQEICFSIKNDQSQTEQDISCTDQGWNLENFNFSVEVFDSRFIEDNIFTGLTILRANKENLTNLLMGEKSVELGKKIDSLKNKVLREKTKYIGELEDSLKRSLGTLDLGISLEDFILVKKPEDIETTKSDLVKLQERKNKIEKSISDKNKILGLDEPEKISLENPISVMDILDESLAKSFDDINEVAYKRMQEHIIQHLNSYDGDEEEWIEKGVNTYLKQEKEIANSRCPFCSQSLSTVMELIETYKSVFSDEYKGFYDGVVEALSTNYKRFETTIDSFKSIENIVNKNLANCHKWRGYFTEEPQKLIEQIDKIGDKVNQYSDKFITLIEETASKFEKLINQKKKKPFVSVRIDDSFRNKLSTIYGEFEKIVNQYNEYLELLLTEVKILKTRSRNDQLLKDLDDLKSKIIDLTKRIKRYELAPGIEKLIPLREEKNKVERKVKKLQDDLEQKNKEFVEQYFENVTTILNKLGSEGFEIQSIYRLWGGQPVHELTIKFIDEEITHERLPFVFSDADRRALAFSIFIAKLKKKDESELKNTIVFLDDPITSFDDNRISNTLMEIKNLAASCRQMIIAAHHTRFLTDAYDIFKKLSNSDLKFIEIKRDGFGSTFAPVADPKIRLDPYSQKIEMIESFINGDSSINSSDIRLHLRPVLEMELEWRFRKDLKGLSLEGLGSIIDKLKEKKLINDLVSSKLYNFNDVLKDDHHKIDINVDEDTRNLARDILNFVFKEMNPSP